MATKRYFFTNRKGSLLFAQEGTKDKPEPPPIVVEYHEHQVDVSDPVKQKLIESHPKFGKKFWLDRGAEPKPDSGPKYTDGPATTATAKDEMKDDQTETGAAESSGKGKGKGK